MAFQKAKIMASGPITSWEIGGETVETVSDFIFLGSKITAGGDCSHEIIIIIFLSFKKILLKVFAEQHSNSRFSGQGDLLCCGYQLGHSRRLWLPTLLFRDGGGGQYFIFGFHNAHVIRQRLLRANLTSMIFTLMPSTPCLSSTWRTAVST